jgi:hypothetical protein
MVVRGSSVFYLNEHYKHTPKLVVTRYTWLLMTTLKIAQIKRVKLSVKPGINRGNKYQHFEFKSGFRTSFVREHLKYPFLLLEHTVIVNEIALSMC